MYEIAVEYAAGNGNGKVKFTFGGVDKTGEVSLPFGEAHSTGWEDWKEFTVNSSADLKAGVQSMRIHIAGNKQAFKLNYVTLMKI